MGRIPPERPRINTGQSGGSGTEVPQWVQGQSPGRGSGDEVPQKLKLFAHNTLNNGHRKCVLRYINIVRNKMKTSAQRDANTARWL